MDSAELFHEISMSYSELTNYLLGKYGLAQHDYFTSSECRSKSRKVRRVNEGLICHHIREDFGANLSNESSARKQPFSWQLKENLVYCNLLEHLLLHIKIAILRQKHRFFVPDEISSFLTTGGIYWICNDINDGFLFNGTDVGWKRKCFQEIRDNYSDYVLLLKSFLLYIDQQYIGIRSENSVLKVGTQVDGYKIKKITNGKDHVILADANGNEFYRPIHSLSNYLTYADCLDILIRELCTGHNEWFNESIYLDILNCNDNRISDIANALTVDYRGHGFPQFTDQYLDRDIYGSVNVDEYVSKAFSFSSSPPPQFVASEAHFWIGSIPKSVQESNCSFIVRVKTSFQIKPGISPFIRYREHDLLRTRLNEISEENNLVYHDGIILSASDIYDSASGKWYSYIIDHDGKRKLSTAILTLQKEEYELFQKTHVIRCISVLDGCYFT